MKREDGEKTTIRTFLCSFVKYFLLTLLFILMLSMLLLIVYEIRSIYHKFSQFDVVDVSVTTVDDADDADDAWNEWEARKAPKFVKESFEYDFKRCGRIQRSSTPRIINGDPTRPHSFPWLVSLREFDNLYLYDHFCSGSLITRYHVLTAAHCLSKFKATSANGLLVLAGLHIRNDLSAYAKRNTYKVRKLIVHEDYKQSTSENDIALIVLARPVELSENVSLVCLPFELSNSSNSNGSVAKSNLTFVGWGMDENQRASLELKQTTMNILDAEKSPKCSNYINERNRERIYCAMSARNNSNVCSGDSGGSLSQSLNDQWTIYGLASYVSAFRVLNDTRIFCDASYPAFFTRISAYIDWIRAHYFFS